MRIQKRIRAAQPRPGPGERLASRLAAGLVAVGAAALLHSCASDAASKQPQEWATPFDEAVATISELPEHPRQSASSAFWERWGDGRAELGGYRGQIARYGELRDAEAVLIYVTEGMDRSRWIKDESAPDARRVPVLKLNHHTTFDTGIYPYSVLTSVFAPVDDWGRERFEPTKITMTVQEWCGQVFHGLWPGPGSYFERIASYFESEGDEDRTVETGTRGATLYEDALFIQLRELDGPFGGAGDSDADSDAGATIWRGQLVPSLWYHRVAHRPTAPVEATIARTRAERALSGGWEVAVNRFTVRYGDAETTIDVERAAPHRVIGWARSDGTHFELVNTVRLPYWQLNANADAHYRDQLFTPEESR